MEFPTDIGEYYNSHLAVICGLSRIGSKYEKLGRNRQDNFSILSTDTSFAIATFDGLGSHSHSEWGAKWAGEWFKTYSPTLISHMQRLAQNPTNQSAYFTQTIQALRQHIFSRCAETFPSINPIDACGTTIIAFLTDGVSYLSFNIGDGVSTITSPEGSRLLNKSRRLKGIGVQHLTLTDPMKDFHYEIAALPTHGSIILATDGLDDFLLSQNQFNEKSISTIIQTVVPALKYKFSALGELHRVFAWGDELEKRNPNIKMDDDRTLVIANWQKRQPPLAQQVAQTEEHGQTVGVDSVTQARAHYSEHRGIFSKMAGLFKKDL